MAKTCPVVRRSENKEARAASHTMQRISYFHKTNVTKMVVTGLLFYD